MSRRARAAGYAAAAALCAGLAAGAAGGAPVAPGEQYGELREVVVAAEGLPAGRRLGRTAVAEALELRRVPERFLPPDALRSTSQALGRRPAAPIPSGGYLLASQFETPGAASDRVEPRLAGDRRPVEITVAGAAALAAAGGGQGRRVDVVVTTESGPTGDAGRTFVAAEEVGLLDLRPAAGEASEGVLGPAAGDSWIATLALSRPQALRLIQAQSFAREVRLIGS